MSVFMLLLHDAPTDFADVSPEEMQGIVAEYVAWREGLERDGRLVGSNKLADEGGRELSTVDGELRIVDGPYAEAKEVVGGYFLIEADDYDHAVELSKECPHLAHGRRIELRRVDELGS